MDQVKNFFPGWRSFQRRPLLLHIDLWITRGRTESSQMFIVQSHLISSRIPPSPSPSCQLHCTNDALWREIISIKMNFMKKSSAIVTGRVNEEQIHPKTTYSKDDRNISKYFLWSLLNLRKSSNWNRSPFCIFPHLFCEYEIDMQSFDGLFGL